MYQVNPNYFKSRLPILTPTHITTTTITAISMPSVLVLTDQPVFAKLESQAFQDKTISSDAWHIVGSRYTLPSDIADELVNPVKRTLEVIQQ